MVKAVQRTGFFQRAGSALARRCFAVRPGIQLVRLRGYDILQTAFWMS